MTLDIWIDEFVHLSGSDGEYTMQFHHMGTSEKTGETKKTLCKVVYPSTLLHALRLFCEYARTEQGINKIAITNAKQLVEAINLQNTKIEKFCKNFYRECTFQGKKDFTIKDEFKSELLKVVSDVKKIK